MSAGGGAGDGDALRIKAMIVRVIAEDGVIPLSQAAIISALSALAAAGDGSSPQDRR